MLQGLVSCNSWVDQLVLYTLVIYYFNNKFKYLYISTDASGISYNSWVDI
jgi:hypothetical protein